MAYASVYIFPQDCPFGYLAHSTIYIYNCCKWLLQINLLSIMHIARLFLACHVQPMIRRSVNVARTSSRLSLVFLYLSTYQRPLMSSDVMAFNMDTKFPWPI